MATMEELLMMATDDKDAYAPGSDFATYLESNKKIIDNKLKNNDKSYFVNDKQLSKFIDPDTAPVPVLEQFAKNPNYSPESTDYSFGDAQIKSILLKNRQNKKNEALNKDLDMIKKVAKYNADLEKKYKKENKKEEFVPRDTLLGRIFDKRVKPGEDISNADKASAMPRSISDNLLERRLVGGKEGTDTLSRILGPSGGIREGMTEIEALESAARAKNLENILTDQQYRKGEADIQKVIADTALKNAGINTENMDSDTKFAYYQTLAELGTENIGTATFQKKLLENMKRQQSVEILDNIGPEYVKALDAIKTEEPGTPAHDRALRMLQLYGQYLPGLDEVTEKQDIRSSKELTNS